MPFLFSDLNCQCLVAATQAARSNGCPKNAVDEITLPFSSIFINVPTSPNARTAFAAGG
jgi:hypothetical protein